MQRGIQARLVLSDFLMIVAISFQVHGHKSVCFSKTIRQTHFNSANQSNLCTQ